MCDWLGQTSSLGCWQPSVHQLLDLQSKPGNCFKLKAGSEQMILDSSSASIFVLPGMYAVHNQTLRLMQNWHISFVTLTLVTALYCTEWLVPIFDTEATAVVLSIINLVCDNMHSFCSFVRFSLLCVKIKMVKKPYLSRLIFAQLFVYGLSLSQFVLNVCMH